MNATVIKLAIVFTIVVGMVWWLSTGSYEFNRLNYRIQMYRDMLGDYNFKHVYFAEKLKESIEYRQEWLIRHLGYLAAFWVAIFGVSWALKGGAKKR